MSGKKGYQATRRLRRRAADKRGGNQANQWPHGEAGSLAAHAETYLQWLP